jgi:hypothetical protein
MSSRNAKARQKPSWREPPEVGESMTVDAWVPDYDQKCFVCGESPTVTGVVDGHVVYDGGMCGACTWGNASDRDPANW